MRIYVIVFGIVWFGILGVALVGGLRHQPSGTVLIPLLMLAFGAVLISSNLRMSAIAESNELRVRNFVSEQRYDRSAISRFVEICSMAGDDGADPVGEVGVGFFVGVGGVERGDGFVGGGESGDGPQSA